MGFSWIIKPISGRSVCTYSTVKNTFKAENRCECPSCWILGEDEATCSPDLEKISISCSPTKLLIEIDECIYVGTEENVTLSFQDEMCSSTNQNGSLILTTSLGKSLRLFISNQVIYEIFKSLF